MKRIDRSVRNKDISISGRTYRTIPFRGLRIIADNAIDQRRNATRKATASERLINKK